MLPDELWLLVFDKLDFPCRARVRRVCTHWNNLLLTYKTPLSVTIVSDHVKQQMSRSSSSSSIPVASTILRCTWETVRLTAEEAKTFLSTYSRGWCLHLNVYHAINPLLELLDVVHQSWSQLEILEIETSACPLHEEVDKLTTHKICDRVTGLNLTLLGESESSAEDLRLLRSRLPRLKHLSLQVKGVLSVGMVEALPSSLEVLWLTLTTLQSSLRPYGEQVFNRLAGISLRHFSCPNLTNTQLDHLATQCGQTLTSVSVGLDDDVAGLGLPESLARLSRLQKLVLRYRPRRPTCQRRLDGFFSLLQHWSKLESLSLDFEFDFNTQLVEQLLLWVPQLKYLHVRHWGEKRSCGEQAKVDMLSSLEFLETLRVHVPTVQLEALLRLIQNNNNNKKKESAGSLRSIYLEGNEESPVHTEYVIKVAQELNRKASRFPMDTFRLRVLGFPVFPAPADAAPPYRWARNFWINKGWVADPLVEPLFRIP